MTRRAVVVTCLAIFSLLPPAGAAVKPHEVNIEFSDYRPSQLDVLPGEAVSWTNVSQRTHTVTSDTGRFDSGEVAPGGRFAQQFTVPGTYRYHCTIHPSIVGEIDVRQVTLEPLPAAAVPVGAKVALAGRTADPAKPVSIERLSGSSFTAVATAVPTPDGSWKATVTADATGDYRASNTDGQSQTRRLLVGTRAVHVRATRTGVSFVVTPSAPYARVLIEVFLRERFGWWPVARSRADYVSRGTARLRRPARVRVVLVDSDGWTPLATSRVVVLR